MFLFSTAFCQISCNLIENTELTILYDAEFSFLLDVVMEVEMCLVLLQFGGWL